MRVKLTDSKNRVLEDIQLAGSGVDIYVEKAFYEDDGTEVPEEELSAIDSDDLGWYIANNY